MRIDWVRLSITNILMKNTKAKFNNKVKEAIYNRENWVCFNCWSSWTDCHHYLYGLESERTIERNNVNKWVLTCRICHDIIHSCKSWQWLRQKAVEYWLTL